MNQRHQPTHFEFLSGDDNIPLENKFLSSFVGSLSLFWLLVSALFLLVESIKLHAPEVFTQLSWTNYGRIHQAAQLGFLSAVTHGLFWLGFSQIVAAGQFFLKSKKTILISFSFLNLSILIGIIEILTGNVVNGTGIFPPFSLFLFTLGVLFLTPTLWRSLFKIGSLSPSLLFVALPFWTLPFSLVSVLTLSYGGFLKGAYGAWSLSLFTHHYISLFLLPLGISALLDYTQQITQKNIRNTNTLKFGFWIYTLSHLLTSSDLISSPLIFLPAWLRALDTVGSVFSSFSLFVILWTIYTHIRPTIQTLKNEVSFCFFGFSALSLATLAFFKAFLSFRTIEAWIQFTSLTGALQSIFFFGFLTMILFAWIYDQAPVQLDRVWASSRLIQTHFWLASLSTGVTFLALLVAGGLQAYRNTVQEIPFLSTVVLIKPLLWLQSLSLVFQFSGIMMISLLFLLLQLNWKPNPKNSMFMDHA
jgi:cbb3-type cytochrome oxidase subunit 1